MGQFVDRGAILAQFQNSHGRFFGCGRQSSSVCEMHMGFWSIWSWTWWSRQFICDCAFPAFRAWLTHSFKSQLYGYDKGRSTTPNIYNTSMVQLGVRASSPLLCLEVLCRVLHEKLRFLLHYTHSIRICLHSACNQMI